MGEFSLVNNAFETCTVAEDVYKLGLCLLVEGQLNAIEDKLHIWQDILKMVEDVDYFFNYPWGNTLMKGFYKGDLPLYPGLGKDPEEADEEEDTTFEKFVEIVSQVAEAAKIFDDDVPKEEEEVVGLTPLVALATALASAPPPAPASTPVLAELIEWFGTIEQQFLASWGGVEDVYWCQNYEQQHWLAIEASISSWTLTIYDSDISVISDAKIEEIMNTWCLLLPSLLMQSKLFTDSLMLKIPVVGKRPHQFTWCRKMKHELTQLKGRWNCGVYVFKHIEHLMVGLSLETICEENIEVFRNKWTTNLWYQFFLP
ncbi:uncharacterized protein LOC133795495 [Humulus lupulus]|uniref:uncharacterized protein LOC133795495 n=1 Tax=Humulus lupulus TaxID=3486 RepID=UPI002B4141BC|nr:uncharacterized protein LOC133795495 [Humulus lupulus]